jgi:endonuclease/exonuclease/phosphatase family metal-dependent hydrolase
LWQLPAYREGLLQGKPISDRALPHFRLASLNGGGNTRRGDPVRLLQALRTIDADVAALQELTPSMLETMRRELAVRYPYESGSWPVVVFSRFRLGHGHTLEFLGRGSDAQYVELHLDTQRVGLFNVHITRPVSARGLPTLARTYNPHRRDAHVAHLAAEVRRVRAPLLLAGDLNATQRSRAYRLLRAMLHDSFLEARRGLGHTYPARVSVGPLQLRLPPLLRIDYVFHSAELETLAARVGPDAGSDHLPVVVDFRLRDSTQPGLNRSSSDSRTDFGSTTAAWLSPGLTHWPRLPPRTRHTWLARRRGKRRAMIGA